jgi:hypothetical protein
LRIPSSYLPTGADDGASQYNDGRVGTAYIQELRFNKYCERLQDMVAEDFNSEFKLYLQSKGANIDYAMFDLRLTPPQNFAAYRQAELDNNRISTFTSMAAVPYISNRFALERFLGLSTEEIAENERLWREENDENLTDLVTDDMAGEMRGAGLSGADLAGDFGGLEDELGDDLGGIDGGTDTAPETNTGDELGGGGAEPNPAQTI